MWWWAAVAIAGMPDHVAFEFDDGFASVSKLAASSDGEFVSGVALGSAVVLEVDGWTFGGAKPSDCTVTAAHVATLKAGTRLWAGCDDGLVYEYDWTGSAFKASGASVDLGSGKVEALVYDANTGRVYAVAAAASGSTTTSLQILSFVAGSSTVGSSVVTLLSASYSDMAVNSANQLYVAHGGDDISSYSFGSGAAVASLPSIGIEVSDIAASRTTSAWVADKSGGRIAQYLQTQQFQVVLTGLDSPSALASFVAPTGVSDDWLAIFDGSTVDIHSLSTGTLTSTVAESFTGPTGVSDAVVTADGYLFTAGTSGVAVLTDRPWVEVVSVEPESAVSGDTVTVTFTVDTDVDYEIFRGGDRTGSGSAVSSGTATAGDELTADFVVDGDFEEGNNAVYLLATDDGGRSGHGRASIFVDNIPTAVDLGGAALGFSNRALLLNFEGVNDADLESYAVYVSTTPFEPGDYATGGPPFDGDDELTTPVIAEAKPGGTQSIRISPLTNGQTYYVAVRAVDAQGKEGPMSEVVTGVPKPASTAAALADEKGGVSCSSLGSTGGASLWGLGLLAAAGAARRRKGALVGLVGLSVATTAEAAPFGKRIDQSKTFANFELRYGGLFPQDANLKTVYGDTGHMVLNMEAGPTLFQVLELDFLFGFYQKLNFTIDPDTGARSADRTMMTWYPLGVDATLRLHLIDEQPIVPFGRAGVDYVLWNEKSDNGAGGKDKISGSKFGWHWGVGGNILLDMFAPGRASQLEAHSGINDSWLTVEYRRQMFNTDGLDFSGSQFTVGLKLDW